MFTTVYNKSPLTSDAANEIFSNITGDSYRGDVSFLSMMRALLYDRLGEKETAKLRYKEVSFSRIKDIDPNDNAMYSELAVNGEDKNTVDIVYVCGSDQAVIDLAFKKFEGASSLCGIPVDEPSTKTYFEQVMKARCFIDFTNSRTIVLIFSRMSIVNWHYCAVLTSRFFKGLFDLNGNEKPLTDWERSVLIDGISNQKTSDQFSSAIFEFSKKFDFRSPMIRKALEGFENRDVAGRIQNIDNQIQSIIRNIEDANSRYARYVRQKTDLEERKEALVLKKKDDGECGQLMNYFLSNDNLYLSSYNDEYIEFYLKTPFANFNSELAAELLKRPDRAERGDIYNGGPSGVSVADKDILFKALFVDKTIRVWLYGKFRIYSSGDYTVKAESGFDTPIEMSDCCPNPHIFNHACMGDNLRYAIDCALAGDYVGAVEYCVGSVASVNLNEGVTAPRWMPHLMSNSYGRFFETADGTRMNYSEVMKYLKELEKGGKK